MKSISEMIVRTSGVEVAGMGVWVGMGIGVRVFVGSKVNIGWMVVAVGLGVAQPLRKAIHRRKRITTNRDVEELLLTGLSPGTFYLLYILLFMLPLYQLL